MKTVAIIPARFESVRYPGKPLALLKQPDGTSKSLIEMTWEAAGRISGVDEIYVATDDQRIRELAQSIGASVIMTSSDCENGTARCADAVARANLDADIIVNFQGDAPLTPPWFVEDLIGAMKANVEIQMATPVVRCDSVTYQHLVEDRRHGRVGGTTAVFDSVGNALYFSKEVLPYFNPDATQLDPVPVFHHVGVYSYRPSALESYIRWPAGNLERLEGLEQLRFLENGCPVKCVIVEGQGRVFWEVNNPSDVPRIEALLAAQ